MLQKLELESLNADLAAVTALLEQAIGVGDSVGKLQFEHRKEELERQITQMENLAEHSASVALFFGGKPVIGSKGIFADFAGKSLESFQEMLSKYFATLESGDLGKRGPVPFKQSTDLLVTNIARGSFGFILEEASVNESLTDTHIKFALDQLSELVARVASPDEELFERAVESLDPRVLISLRSFFRTLDDAGATIRVVEDKRDYSLTYPDVQRARLRTEAIDIEERDSDSLVGELIGLLPQHRKFELRRSDTGEIVYGSIAREISNEHLDTMSETGGVVGKQWRVKVKIREVRERNRRPKLTYTLLGLLEEIHHQKD